jgi:hypothetical protein
LILHVFDLHEFIPNRLTKLAALVATAGV